MKRQSDDGAEGGGNGMSGRRGVESRRPGVALEPAIGWTWERSVALRATGVPCPSRRRGPVRGVARSVRAHGRLGGVGWPPQFAKPPAQFPDGTAERAAALGPGRDLQRVGWLARRVCGAAVGGRLAPGRGWRPRLDTRRRGRSERARRVAGHEPAGNRPWRAVAGSRRRADQRTRQSCRDRPRRGSSSRSPSANSRPSRSGPQDRHLARHAFRWARPAPRGAAANGR
jgi:hypothetical protein